MRKEIKHRGGGDARERVRVHQLKAYFDYTMKIKNFATKLTNI